MAKNVLRILCFLPFALLLGSCVNDDDGVDRDCGEVRGDELVLNYTVNNGPSLSRTRGALTEDGWGDWNENLVTRLDLFVVRGGAVVYKFAKSGLSESAEYSEQHTGISVGNLKAGDVLYLVANAPTGLNGKTTLADLQAVTLTGLKPASRQASFLMDGSYTLTTDDLSKCGNLTKTIPLSRAAAKVVIGFGSNSSVTDWTNVTYKYVNFATNSFVLSGKEGLQDDVTNNDFVDKTLASSEAFTAPGDQLRDNQLVLYLYPEFWFNAKVTKNKTGGTYNIADIGKEEPFDPSKQPYVLLKAKWTDGNYYVYKVPLNYLLPLNVDQASFTESDVNDIKKLYLIQRNSLYRITVTIDRTGGVPEGDDSKGVTIPYVVEQFDGGHGGDVEME